MMALAKQERTTLLTHRYPECEPESLGDGEAFVVRPWPLTTRPAFDPRSGYAETFWLPVIGPTAYLLARRLRSALDRNPEVKVTPDVWASCIGVGPKVFVRAIDRLVTFHLARWVDDVLVLRMSWPVVPAKSLARMPALQSADRAVAS